MEISEREHRIPTSVVRYLPSEQSDKLPFRLIIRYHYNINSMQGVGPQRRLSVNFARLNEAQSHSSDNSLKRGDHHLRKIY